MKLTANNLRLARLHHPGCDDDCVFVGMRAQSAGRAGRWIEFYPRPKSAKAILYLLWSYANHLRIVGEDEMRYVVCNLRHEDLRLHSWDVLNHANNGVRTAHILSLIGFITLFQQPVHSSYHADDLLLRDLHAAPHSVGVGIVVGSGQVCAVLLA